MPIANLYPIVSSPGRALVVEQNTSIPVALMTSISIVAVVNGTLLQIIMASRVLYGIGKKGIGSSILATVHPRTQTPLSPNF